MKAIRIHRFGDESALQYEDVPVPELAPRDVLIHVEAASVNRADLGRRTGSYAAGSTPLPYTPGSDVAGVIQAIGVNVSERKVGDRVTVLLNGGGYAEQVVTHVAGTTPIPDSLSSADACTIPVVFLTAWFGLLQEAGLKAGEDVLIQSGASGVGTAAIQIAKHVGARVFATAGSDEKVRKMRELGADVAINYTAQDFAQEVMATTRGKGVEVVLESVGGDVYAKSLGVLARGGRLCSVGNSSGAPQQEPDPALVRERGLTITRFGLPSEIPGGGTRRELPKIIELFREGKLRAVVDRTFPLAQAEAAHRFLAERRNFGKVVLVP